MTQTIFFGDRWNGYGEPRTPEYTAAVRYIEYAVTVAFYGVVDWDDADDMKRRAQDACDACNRHLGDVWHDSDSGAKSLGGYLGVLAGVVRFRQLNVPGSAVQAAMDSYEVAAVMAGNLRPGWKIVMPSDRATSDGSDDI